MELIKQMKSRRNPPSPEERAEHFKDMQHPYQRNEDVAAPSPLPPLLLAARGVHVCMMCDSTFETADERDQHEFQHFMPGATIKKWHCCECGSAFKDKRSWKFHQTTQHTADGGVHKPKSVKKSVKKRMKELRAKKNFLQSL